jgi:ABC-2 type transport system ATP-binding protein
VSWGLEAVTVDFGDTTALTDVDISLRPGSITAVVGGDGAGKTTLARTLAGLTRVTAGRVIRPERVGFQPEMSGVWRDLTVEENLGLVAKAYRMGNDEAGSRIGELLEITGLTGARDRLGGELSGGMRQKLGAAMALLATPELLVLDEPTTGLDPVSRVELWAFITRAAAEGRAVLVTTAYVNEAERAGTIVVLDEGHVLAAGALEEVLAAVPGKLFITDHPGDALSWRRGGSWRIWSPSGAPPEGATPIVPDLQDAVTVAALARRVA